MKITLLISEFLFRNCSEMEQTSFSLQQLLFFSRGIFVSRTLSFDLFILVYMSSPYLLYFLTFQEQWECCTEIEGKLWLVLELFHSYNWFFVCLVFASLFLSLSHILYFYLLGTVVLMYWDRGQTGGGIWTPCGQSWPLSVHPCPRRTVSGGGPGTLGPGASSLGGSPALLLLKHQTRQHIGNIILH